MAHHPADDAPRALCAAAGEGDVDAVARHIAARVDVNAFENTDERTPIQRAAAEGHLAAIALLLRAGARPDAKDADGVTALVWAAVGGHADVASALIAAGADVNWQGGYHNSTALHAAATHGRASVVRVLLAAGAKKDAVNRSGRTPLEVVSQCLRQTTALPGGR
jgi:ankyrin repeat protein